MSEPAFDIGKFVKETADTHSRLVQVGMEIADEKFYTKIRGLEAAYQKAVLDPETKIPSYLMAVLVSMFGMLPERYAEAMIQRDKLTRYEGRPDQDLDAFGRPLKAGM